MSKSSKPIPDYTESQIWTVAESLKERFRKEIDIQLIESEVRLSPHDHELTMVPGLYWMVDGCQLQVQSDYERNNKQEQEAA